MQSRWGPIKKRLAKSTKVAVTVICSTAFVLVAGGTAAHADYYSGGMPSRTFAVRMVGINDTWVNCFWHGAGYYNGNAGAHITQTPGAASTFTAGRYSQSWYGLYSPHGIRSINRTFDIQVNARTLEQDSGSQMANWMKSTCAHEVGHSLSLADNPNTTRASLMKHNRNRSTMIYPQAYDLEEIERIY